jgi:lipopolysaccharide export system permease protein
VPTAQCRQSMNLRPRKLHIFIAKQFGILFAGAFFICQFVLMMQFLWRYVDTLIGKGLSLDVMAQFFWYAGLTFVPRALPLAILLAALITFGNLGESSELTALKSAGISLMQIFKPLVFIVLLICGGSFIFQNYVGPNASLKLSQLLISMKQKSPELDIPEGVFYDGIPQCNVFVQQKNIETGKLYGLTIYRMTGSYEDQAIILADSGMIQATADKKHLLLTLWDGEWFENMQSQELGGKASVPYRRETFYHKKILIDFNDDFNMADASLLSNDARAKGLPQLAHDTDSLVNRRDSLGRALYDELKPTFYQLQNTEDTKANTAKRNIAKTAVKAPAKHKAAEKSNIDSVYSHLPTTDKQRVVTSCMNTVNREKAELEFRAMISSDVSFFIRTHNMQKIAIFTLSFSCLIFFFIGAPIGAIIRKGGLGLPMIVSVLVFIVYYILDNSGTRMAKIDAWNLWFGCLLSTIVLTPLAAFVTYKANKDAIVFNADAFMERMRRLLGLRNQRHIAGKEVIIDDPNYADDAATLEAINLHIDNYVAEHRLRKLPNIIKVFFRYRPDHEIEHINERLEDVIEDLSNTRDKLILTEINNYPILEPKAHTRPFERRWMNIAAAVIVPVGIFLYFRMVRFRLRLSRDLAAIKAINDRIAGRIATL